MTQSMATGLLGALVADAAAFVRKWSDEIAGNPDYGLLLVWIGDELNKSGAAREAMTYYLNALRHKAADPVVMNNVAWQMATNDDARVRNGAEAVKWAAKTIKLTKNTN